MQGHHPGASDNGNSALHNAVERDLRDIVEYLLSLSPRVNKELKNKKGKTAEELAQKRSKKNIKARNE